MGGRLLFRKKSNLGINDLGKENAISKMMISILGIVQGLNDLKTINSKVFFN